MDQENRLFGIGILLGALSGLFFSLLASTSPIFIFSDQATQAAACQQCLEGVSPLPNAAITPVERDLSKNTKSWITWWAPGYPTLLFFIARTGLSLGVAAKVVASLFLIASCAGWGGWFSLFNLPRNVFYILVICTPCIRAFNQELLYQSGEVLSLAIIPWIYLGAHFLIKAWMESSAIPSYKECVFASGYGFLLALAYCLKYSGFLISFGVFLFLAYKTVRIGSLVSILRWITVGIATAIPVLALNVLNHQLGSSSNLLTASWHLHFNPMTLIDIVGTPSLAMADAGQIFDWMFLNPDHGLFHQAIIVPMLGIPGTVILLILLLNHSWSRLCEIQAVFVLIVVLVCMELIWTASPAVSHERRFIAPAAIALLPLVISCCLSHLQSGKLFLRATATLLLSCYICAPILYGAATFGGKLYRVARYHPTANFIYNPMLADENLESAAKHLNEYQEGNPASIWYCPDTLTTLDLRGRKIVGEADFLSIEQLANKTYLTSKPLKVFVLLPPKFESQGKGVVIRNSFPQATAWQRITIPDSNYDLWMADLDIHALR